MKNLKLTIHRQPTIDQQQADTGKKTLTDSQQYLICNVSRGGIRFSSQEGFEIDERVDLALYVDGLLSHQAKGRICYHDEDSDKNHYYGVSFLDKYLPF